MRHRLELANDFWINTEEIVAVYRAGDVNLIDKHPEVISGEMDTYLIVSLTGDTLYLTPNSEAAKRLLQYLESDMA